MAINDDTDYPRLTPPDDRYPSPGNLFRTAGDLADDQFDILAAGWSEDALPDDSLNEMEALFASDPRKRAYAENFRQLRLRPYDEKWTGLHSLMRLTPTAKIIRRVWIPALVAAAVILAFIVLGPFTDKQTSVTSPVSSAEIAMVPEAVDAAPAVIKEVMPEPELSVNKRSLAAVEIKSVTAVKEELPVQVREEPVKTTPVTVTARSEAPVIKAGIDSRELLAVNFNEIPASQNIPEREENWLMKGIAGLSKSGKKEKTPVDGYVIARSCIKGINSVFGSDMELEKIVSAAGDTVAVSFNSSLLSFSAPVRKSSQ
ncbi:MAG TPA: hypothetical protein VN276_02065 [Bacteroidales bacterium]|nr:hypothetical protein [Bacteroidales bacterium]